MSDTHKIDYVKGKVAFDLELNSKDQTFDRDLYAFRALLQRNEVAVKIVLDYDSKMIRGSANLRSTAVDFAKRRPWDKCPKLFLAREFHRARPAVR